VPAPADVARTTQAWGSLRSTWLSTAVLVAAMFGHIAMHVDAGWTLPVPWPDEVHFLLPAESLADRGTFAVPGLHPDRPLMWMPPGYAAAMAAVFTITGPSLAVARWASMLAVLVAAVALWRLCTAVAHRGLATGIVALFVLHPAVLVIGNVARMDAWMLAVSLTAMACLHRRPLLALALLLGATLVHPNALFFLASAVVYGVWAVRAGTVVVRPSRGELVVLGVAVVAVFAYAIHVSAQWSGFVADMGVQLERKAGRDVAASFTGRRLWMALGLIALTAVPTRRAEHLRLLAVALPAYLVQRLGHEMWYHPFDVLFTAVFAVAAFQMAASVAPGVWARWRSAAVVPGAAALALVVVAIWPDHPQRPANIRWRHMRMAEEAYVRPTEVRSVAAGLTGRVQFLPRGDAALFLGVSAPSQGGFEIVDDVRHPSHPDVLIIHESSHHPRHWRRRTAKALAQAQQDGRARRIETDPASARWWRVQP